MDLALLKTFLSLSETKSFTASAKKMYRSQSAISLQVTRLEEIIGKPLFKRDNRNVTLTREGEELVSYARQMVALEKNLLGHFHEPEVSGEVSFGTPEDIATAYLPEVLANFVKDYPGVILNVNCEFTLNLLTGYETKQYDLILIKQDPKQPHPNSKEVWKESLVWVCSSKVRPKSAYPLDGRLPLILAPSPCVYRKRALDALDKAGIQSRIIYNSPSLNGAIAAVKAGLGISVLPRKLISSGMQKIDYLPPLQDAQIALVHSDHPSPVVKVLSEYLAQEISTNMQV